VWLFWQYALVDMVLEDCGFPDSLVDLARLGGYEVLYIPWMQATYVMAASTEAVEHLPAGTDLESLTYADVLAWAEVLESETGSPQFGLPAGEDGLLHRFFQGYLYPSFTGALNTAFTSPDAVAGWEWLVDIWEYTNPQSTVYGFMQEPLLAGEVQLAWDHTARIVDAVVERPDDFVLFPSPVGPDGLGFMPVVAGLAIPETAPDPEGARELIQYLTSPEIAALTLDEVAFFPATSVELTDELPAGLDALATAVQQQQDSGDALPSLLPIGLGEQGGEYNKVFQDSFRRIVLQGEPPAQVLEAELPQLQAVLEASGAACWFPDPDSDGPCPAG
jgi:multiple sugar transport system substrate-binding protein